MVLSACTALPTPGSLASQEVQCDIGPSWNETPIWDSGEVHLSWRYHSEADWNGVCESSSWGCIHCRVDPNGERACVVDLRMRPRFSNFCHMAVMGHELGHALGKAHYEARARTAPVVLARANPPALPPEGLPSDPPVALKVAPDLKGIRITTTDVFPLELAPLEELEEISLPRLYILETSAILMSVDVEHAVRLPEEVVRTASLAPRKQRALSR